jgi:hypothetical protein
VPQDITNSLRFKIIPWLNPAMRCVLQLAKALELIWTMLQDITNSLLIGILPQLSSAMLPVLRMAGVFRSI